MRFQCLPEAPCSHVVEFARTQVHQCPDGVSDVMRRFAAIPLNDAEKGCRKLFVENQCLPPCKVEHVSLGAGALSKFPYLKFSSWAQWLLDSKRLWRLFCGVSSWEKMREVLAEFWERYRAIRPSHEVDLSRTVPYFSHQDEGRGYKHQAIMIFSSHGCLGRGTSTYVRRGRHLLPTHRSGLGLNFLGNTWASQALFMTMLRSTSDANPDAIPTMMEIYARDASDLGDEGVTSADGQMHIWMIHLNSKADLPALSKIAGFPRSFAHVPRQVSSRNPCGGICPWCLAGREADANGQCDLPFEDFSLRPNWLGTIEAEEPWSEEPILMAGQPMDRSMLAHFFATDIWRNFHLGIGKHFVANSFVAIIERTNMWAGQSVEKKLQNLTDAFKQYCKKAKVTPHMMEISRSTMTWPFSSVAPVGAWSKGSQTTCFMKFLEEFLESNLNDCDDVVIRAVATCPSDAFHFVELH